MAEQLHQRAAVAEPQFGFTFGSAASTTQCNNIFGIGCASSTQAATTATATCGFFGFGCTSPTTTSQQIPLGTGLPATITTTDSFGQPTTVVGRLYEYTTTDAAGDSISGQGLAAASTNILLSATTIRKSSATTSRSSITSTSTNPPSTLMTSSTSSYSTSSSALANSAETTTAAPVAQSHSSSGISGGAIAAAVIVPLLALAVIGAAIFFVLRRKRRQRESGRGLASSDDSASPASHFGSTYFGDKTGGIVREKQDPNNYSGSTTAVSTVHPSRVGSSDRDYVDKSGVVEPSYHPSAVSREPPQLHLPIGIAVGHTPQELDDTAVSPTAHAAPYPQVRAVTSPSELPAETNSPTSQGGARAIPQQLFAPARPAYTAANDSLHLTPVRSATPSNRHSFDDDDASALSDNEYQVAELASAAVGITHRASVINMINATGSRHGREGSQGSSRKSSA